MSTLSIKIIALVLMLIDHIGEFIPGIPVYFRWLGRLSAPLFVFCVIIAIKNTSNPKKYVKRLYIGSAIMGIGNAILIFIYPNSNVFLTNNIFPTLMFIAILAFLDMLKKENPKKALSEITKFIMWQIISIVIIMILSTTGNSYIVSFVNGIFSNIISCEGSIPFVLLGFILYKYGDTKKDIAKTYIIYCAIYASISILGAVLIQIPGMSIIDYLFKMDYQWMMILSLPIMLSYNGQKGKSINYCKYLFYIFYPIHIWILFIISNNL